MPSRPYYPKEPRSPAQAKGVSGGGSRGISRAVVRQFNLLAPGCGTSSRRWCTRGRGAALWAACWVPGLNSLNCRGRILAGVAGGVKRHVSGPRADEKDSDTLD